MTNLNKQLKAVAVDLTPILPGGENGGAKVFVLELLKVMSEEHPETRFILLTQLAAHEELAHLDSLNVSRIMVLGGHIKSSLKNKLISKMNPVIKKSPAIIQKLYSRIIHRVNYLSKRWESGSVLSELKADLLFCPFTAPTYFEAGIPTVCTLYDLQYKAYPEFFSSEDVVHRHRSFIEASQRATRLAAISEYTRQSALLHGNLDETKVETIHLKIAQRKGINEEFVEAVCSDLELKKERYFIYPANFWKHKNHELLLIAYNYARSTGLDPDIKLVLTGAPGVRRDFIISSVIKMGLEDQVIVPGYVKSDELSALMAGALALVFPSLYEGFGIPIIEAMALGTPVACSNICSLPEIAEDAAEMFDPRIPEQIAEVFLKLAKRSELRDKLIRKGLARAAAFSNSTEMAEQYWRLFEEALNDITQSNSITGIYADGWAGPHLNIHLIKSNNKRTVEFTVVLPEWVQAKEVKIKVNIDGKIRSKTFHVLKGKEERFCINLDPGSDRLSIKFTPTFSPLKIGLGVDERELSIMIKECLISEGEDHFDILFPDASELSSI